jgi:biopolymer transport protein ExbB
MFSISKLSLEGKITTTVLAFMLMLGLNVMLVKSLYVRRVKKANALFSESFPAQMFKPIQADNSSISDSSLNNIHREAIKELSRRIEQGGSISTNAIVTIRSCMNTAMLRETKKLNKQMVLLTIAIAGGPFIGLLGTVMGVMITFADVALAGTVDVNAIAPGISAALVATVAGLLVAIPCLFGYNYLSAQIKEIVGDMRVFVDQFQASIAEHYSE